MTVSGATEGRILATGASGPAGAAVIREFVRPRHLVRALVRNRTDARTFEAFPTVEVVEGDMLRPEALTEALSGVDRVRLISSSDQQMVESQSTFKQQPGKDLVVPGSGELVATNQPARPTVGTSTQVRSWSARSGAR